MHGDGNDVVAELADERAEMGDAAVGGARGLTDVQSLANADHVAAVERSLVHANSLAEASEDRIDRLRLDAPSECTRPADHRNLIEDHCRVFDEDTIRS